MGFYEKYKYYMIFVLFIIGLGCLVGALHFQVMVINPIKNKAEEDQQSVKTPTKNRNILLGIGTPLFVISIVWFCIEFFLIRPRRRHVMLRRYIAIAEQGDSSDGGNGDDGGSSDEDVLEEMKITGGDIIEEKKEQFPTDRPPTQEELNRFRAVAQRVAAEDGDFYISNWLPQQPWRMTKALEAENEKKRSEHGERTKDWTRHQHLVAKFAKEYNPILDRIRRENPHMIQSLATSFWNDFLTATQQAERAAYLVAEGQDQDPSSSEEEDDSKDDEKDSEDEDPPSN